MTDPEQQDRPPGPPPGAATVDMVAVPTLMVELCYAEPPDLTAPEVLAAVRGVEPGAEQLDQGLVVPDPPDDGPLDDELPDDRFEAGLLEQDDPEPPVRPPGPRLLVLPGSGFDEPDKQRPDVGQTWAWPTAQQAVDAATASVLVMELPFDAPSTSPTGASAEPLERLRRLGRVVAALVAVTRPLALHWTASQRVADPAVFGPDDLDGPVNVRMFADGDALVMDTLGLAVLGLPDLQCHFRERPPGEIAELLFVTAVYLVEHGDVIGDGDTISGTDGEGRYRCYRELALLPPHRTVLDVDLGAPWAAGRS